MTPRHLNMKLPSVTLSFNDFILVKHFLTRPAPIQSIFHYGIIVYLEVVHNIKLLIILAVVLISGSAFSAEPVEKEHFVFYFDNQNYIERADSALNRARQQMIALVQDSLDYKPSVYMLEDINEFNKVIRGKIPDWGAAVAFPERQLIALKSPDKFKVGKSIEELLAHEYSHLSLHHRTGFTVPPRWLDEGLAMLVSFEWSWEDNLTMSRAGTFQNFLDLQEIEQMNRFSESKAHLAYAQSYLAVDFLYREYGINAVNRLLDQFENGAGPDHAFNQSIGGSYGQLNDEFQTYLKGRYNIVSLFMDTAWLWIFLALVVIVGVFVRYKKRRKYYKKWEQEDRLQSKDFDYGDPDNPEQIDEEDEPWRG